MSATRFRAPPADALSWHDLDGIAALYHRPSGATHLLVSPAPEILAVLGEGAMTSDELLAALAARYDLADAAAERLMARVEELVAAGLVARE